VKIAIIPARGGSKRIPRKNLRPFRGKPLVCWAIDTACASGLFDRVVVSTDDDDVARLSAERGAETPFVRPAHLSDDHATTDAVIVHAVNEIRAGLGTFETGCCIYPNPFVAASDLQAGHDLLLMEKAASAFPVVAYDFPIEHALVLEGVRPRPRWPEKLDTRSQDLPQYVHDAGLFYWFDTEKFMAGGRLLGTDAAAFIVPSDRTQDLNTAEDWARAEQKFKLLAGTPSP
jgi:N-acylneuraminate cytidylyltransferase